jgi:hypothetical protein
MITSSNTNKKLQSEQNIEELVRRGWVGKKPHSCHFSCVLQVMASKRKLDEMPSITAGKTPIEPFKLDPVVQLPCVWQLHVKPTVFSHLGQSWDQAVYSVYVKDELLSPHERLFLTILGKLNTNCEEEGFSIDRSVPNPETTSDEDLATTILGKGVSLVGADASDDEEEQEQACAQARLDFPFVLLGNVWFRLFGCFKRAKKQEPVAEAGKPQADIPKLEPTS